MEFLDIVGMLLASFVAAAINAVAGGGTFVLFPSLIFFGLTPLSANITSTIAVWPGAVASAYAYRSQWRDQLARLPWLVVISLVGSGVGAWILLQTPADIFKDMVPWLLLSATLIFTFGRHVLSWMKMHEGKNEVASSGRERATRVMQFFIALYGGYFGAGLGILMLAALQVMGMTNIHRMNGLKMVLGAAINAVAVCIFVFSDLVAWNVALIVMIGGIAGGYVGAATALKISPHIVRVIVSVIGFVMSAYFFFV